MVTATISIDLSEYALPLPVDRGENGKMWCVSINGTDQLLAVTYEDACDAAGRLVAKQLHLKDPRE